MWGIFLTDGAQSVRISFMSQKIKGMVRQEARCEMSAMPAAEEVSLPYAAGMTMVFSPKGIASEQTAQIN